MFWKTPLNVPAGIRYLGDWKEFQLSNYPGHNIIHKQIPGCGFTETSLNNPQPVVLSSPRKMLLENKKEQHGDDVYLVVNKYEIDHDIDEDITKPESQKVTDLKDTEEQYKVELFKQDCEQLYQKLYHEIDEYFRRMSIEGKPFKILVTYDSTSIVRDILMQMGILSNFWFVVDEFQSILEDARFKSDIEVEFLSVLQTIPNVIYVSATPLLDRYIQRIPELNIPYYEMDWGYYDKTRIKKPNLKVRTMSSVRSKMKEIIQLYLDGNYERVIVNRNGQLEEVVSNECVIYVNSVNHIINIIKDMKLTPDQVNILCSNTPENQRRIDKKLGKDSGFKIGSVPLKGEVHKMFTLCTRTVYLGADFYSLCARSFIFSDANSDCLSVDISMDLAQILGRQRLDENPWRNSAEFYYRTTCDYKKMTWGDLKKIMDIKEEKTNDILRGWQVMDEKSKSTHSEIYQREAKREKYRNNYIAVNRKVEKGKLIPVFNELVRLQEERSFEIQQIDYANRFSVFCSLQGEFTSIGESDAIKDFFIQYESVKILSEKLKMVCEYIKQFPEWRDIILDNLSDSDRVKEYITSLGEDRCRGLGYNITKMNEAKGITIFDRSTFENEIYSSFTIGSAYSKKGIKSILGDIYLSAGFKGTPKASDLENWFELRPCKRVINGSKENCFEIIKQK